MKGRKPISLFQTSITLSTLFFGWQTVSNIGAIPVSTSYSCCPGSLCDRVWIHDRAHDFIRNGCWLSMAFLFGEFLVFAFSSKRSWYRFYGFYSGNLERGGVRNISWSLDRRQIVNCISKGTLE